VGLWLHHGMCAGGHLTGRHHVGMKKGLIEERHGRYYKETLYLRMGRAFSLWD
jgi:hypothetical protein